MARIGLTGTVSVGKTTLVNAMRAHSMFEKYETATERSKYLMNLGIPLNTDSTLKGQFIFLAERSTELMFNDIITDRTIYDVCAFTALAKSINYDQKYWFEKAAMQLRNEYDLIIYVSPEGVNIEDNGVRTTDSDYRLQIDKQIKNLLELYPPSKLIKVKGTTEERINMILPHIY
jgi:deoxyadenosine/deoxycytidine kinase